MEKLVSSTSSAFVEVTGSEINPTRSSWSQYNSVDTDCRNIVVIADRFHSLEDVRSAIEQQGVGQCRLIFAIDYTISNMTSGSKTFGGKSLHDLSDVNPYQRSNYTTKIVQVITAIGETIDPMRDEQEPIPAFGFGDSVVKDKSVFPLSPERPCFSFYDILCAYNTKTKDVKFGGPTSFVPVIEEAIRLVKETRKYHILIIVADGQVAEERNTLKAIIEASHYPLSIVVIGVGDGPWGVMEEWDDLENFNRNATLREFATRRFDNFQFVNFHRIVSKAKNPDVALALAALMEIPDQYKFIKENLLDNM